MPDLYTKYELTDDGHVIDPPVIADMERQITEASAAGDQAQIDLLTEEYTDKRQKIAERHNKQVDERAQSDAELIARRDEQARVARQQEAERAADQRKREEMDRLRAGATANPTVFRTSVGSPVNSPAEPSAAPEGDTPPSGTPADPTPTPAPADPTPAPAGGGNK